MEWKTVISILLIVHLYLVIRYCVGNIVDYTGLTRTSKFRWLLLVLFVPFIGYYLYLKADLQENI
jgi:hypothetical protein